MGAAKISWKKETTKRPILESIIMLIFKAVKGAGAGRARSRWLSLMPKSMAGDQ